MNTYKERIEELEDTIKYILTGSTVSSDLNANTARLQWVRGVLEDILKEDD